jgi:hypothetical protein
MWHSDLREYHVGGEWFLPRALRLVLNDVADCWCRCDECRTPEFDEWIRPLWGDLWDRWKGWIHPDYHPLCGMAVCRTVARAEK